MRGLIITASVTTPVVAGMARVNMASVLAWSAAAFQTLPPLQDGPSIVQIPLHVLWRDVDGKPLWAATDIYPVGKPLEGREYIHKRYPVARANLGRRMKINTSAGQFKEKRRPVRTLSAPEWQAAVILGEGANPEDIQLLLDEVTNVGSLGAAGYGAVHEWRLEEADLEPEWIAARRNVPARAGLIEGPAKPLRPWVPPYWYSPWWEDCVEGQPCF